MKNLCLKSRPKENPYEVWTSYDGTWQWKVLKKWQGDDAKPYARWFCFVTSPYCPEGEYGDTYVSQIQQQARRTFQDAAIIPAPVEVRPVAYPKKNGKSRKELGQVAGRTWEKMTTPTSVTVRPVPEAAVLIGTPQPEAFLRGDALDRFFQPSLHPE